MATPEIFLGPCMHKQIDRQMDRWTDGRMDEQTTGSKESRVGRVYCYVIPQINLQSSPDEALFYQIKKQATTIIDAHHEIQTPNMKLAEFI